MTPRFIVLVLGGSTLACGVYAGCANDTFGTEGASDAQAEAQADAGGDAPDATADALEKRTHPAKSGLSARGSCATTSTIPTAGSSLIRTGPTRRET